MANLKRIRDLCDEKRLTLKELSEKIGISQNGLQRIMKDNTTRIDTLERIAKVLDVPITAFFQDKYGENEQILEEIKFQRDTYKQLNDVHNAQITIFRYFLKILEDNLQTIVKDDDMLKEDERKAIKNIELYIKFFHEFDHSISIDEIEEPGKILLSKMK